MHQRMPTCLVVCSPACLILCSGTSATDLCVRVCCVCVRATLCTCARDTDIAQAGPREDPHSEEVSRRRCSASLCVSPRVHARTHARTNTNTPTPIHSRIHARARTHTLTHTRTLTYTNRSLHRAHCKRRLQLRGRGMGMQACILKQSVNSDLHSELY